MQRLLGSSDAGAYRARLVEIKSLLETKEEFKKDLTSKRKEMDKSIKQLEAEINDLETNKDKIVWL